MSAIGEVGTTAALSALVTGAGSAYNVPAGSKSFSLQVWHTSNPSAVVVTLEGSNDGVHWFTLLTWTLTPQVNGDVLFVVDKPVNQVRANITTITGGTAPVVSAFVAAG